MNKRLSALFPVLLAVSCAQAAPRVCQVDSLDTRGCRPGDTLLFVPSSWGNEQLPVTFAALKCDFSKEITLTKGGVACIYAGPKKLVLGSEEVARMSYEAVFKKVAANPAGWTKTQAGEYWRVAAKGRDERLRIAEPVELFYQKCEHDIDGTEHRGTFEPDGTIEAVNSSHYVYLVQKEPAYGTLIETVGPTRHGFLRLERPKAKPSGSR